MNNVEQDIKKALSEAVGDLGLEISAKEAEVKSTVDPEFGDLTSTIALKLSKKVGKTPMDFAQEIVSSLAKIPHVKKIQVVKPGFINFYISDTNYKQLLEIIDSNYGKASIGKGKKVMIEYGDVNTHKAMHVGHVKNLISGLSIVRLYENAGYKVFTANYYGDVGMQVAKCTWGGIQKGIPDDFSTWDPNSKAEYMDDCYVYAANKFKDDEKAQAEIREINKAIYDYYHKLGAGNETELTKEIEMYLFWRKISKEHQVQVFKYLGISHDEDYPESQVADNAVRIIKENTGEDKVFQKDDGAIIFRGEDYGLTTWVFLNNEGNPTYSGKDMGLAERKMRDYPDLDLSIMMTSVEQNDYFQAVIKAIELIHPEFEGKFRHISFGWLLIDKKKTSSRKGNALKGMDLIKLSIEQARSKISDSKKYSHDMIEEISTAVGVAALKFLILSHEFHKDINFDPEDFVVLEGFSGPYVLYSYARANSIMQKAQETGIKAGLPSSLENVFTTDEEMDLLKKLSEFPDVALKAYEKVSPHLVCNYIFEVSRLFSNFYDKHQVLGGENDETVTSRLRLVKAVSIVLKNGLDLLGIETVKSM